MFGDKVLNWISENKTIIIILTVLTLGLLLIILGLVVIIILIIGWIKGEQDDNYVKLKVQEYELAKQEKEISDIQESYSILEKKYERNVDVVMRKRSDLVNTIETKTFIHPKYIFDDILDVIEYKNDYLFTVTESDNYIKQLFNKLENLSYKEIIKYKEVIYEGSRNVLFHSDEYQLVNTKIKNFIKKFNKMLSKHKNIYPEHEKYIIKL